MAQFTTFVKGPGLLCPCGRLGDANEPMAKLPYMKWFPNDVEGDEGWRLMSLAERGLYMTLLNYSWINNGLPPLVPDIARAVGIAVRDFEPLWVRVGQKFLQKNELGRLTNKRQEDERTQAKHKSEHGKKAASARHGNAYAHTDAMHMHSTGIEDALPRAYASDSGSVCSKETTVQKSVDSAATPAIESRQAVLRRPANVEIIPIRVELPMAVNGDPGRPLGRDIQVPDAELELWAEAEYGIHPKKTQKFQTLRLLVSRFSEDRRRRQIFSRNHALWIEYWKRIGTELRYIPKLYDFIADDAWVDEPPAVPEPEEERVIEVPEI